MCIIFEKIIISLLDGRKIKYVPVARTSFLVILKAQDISFYYIFAKFIYNGNM